CLTAGRFGLTLASGSYPPTPASVALAGNTLVASQAPLHLMLDPPQERPGGGGAASGFNVGASANGFDGGDVSRHSDFYPPPDPPPKESAFLRCSLSWKGDRNLFSTEEAFSSWHSSPAGGYGIQDLTQWNRFWRQEDSGCRSGKVRYRG